MSLCFKNNFFVVISFFFVVQYNAGKGGAVFAFGSNSRGQCGLNDGENILIPTEIESFKDKGIVSWFILFFQNTNQHFIIFLFSILKGECSCW